MDRFDALPLQQKLLLLTGVLLMVAGAVYFFAISPLEGGINSAKGKQKKLSQDHQALAQYRQKEKLAKLDEEEQSEIAKIDDNKKQLPSEDQLPEFIQSIKSDADVAGLEIMKFDVADRELEDYYARVPVNIRVVGTSLQLITFLKTLAAPNRRIVNVADLRINRVAAQSTKLQSLLGETDEVRALRNLSKSRTLTPQEARALKIVEYEANSKLAFIQAEFTAYAFSYTGEPLPESAKLKRKARKRK